MTTIAPTSRITSAPSITTTHAALAAVSAPTADRIAAIRIEATNAAAFAATGSCPWGKPPKKP